MFFDRNKKLLFYGAKRLFKRRFILNRYQNNTEIREKLNLNKFFIGF